MALSGFDHQLVEIRGSQPLHWIGSIADEADALIFKYFARCLGTGGIRPSEAHGGPAGVLKDWPCMLAARAAHDMATQRLGCRAD